MVGKTEHCYNKSCYEGNFIDGKISGRGVLYLACGSRCECNFVDGKYDMGILYTPGGRRYRKKFTGEKISGMGTMQFQDGSRC